MLEMNVSLWNRFSIVIHQWLLMLVVLQDLFRYIQREKVTLQMIGALILINLKK